VLPGPKTVSLPLQPKTAAILAHSTDTFLASYIYITLFFRLTCIQIYTKIFSSKHFTIKLKTIFKDKSVLRTVPFGDNDRDNGTLAMLIAVKDTFFYVCHHVFSPGCFGIDEFIFYGHI
jgi:hypothetical protein